MQLDKIDKQILNVLFENGRESLSSLSKSVLKSNNEEKKLIALITLESKSSVNMDNHSGFRELS